MQGLSKDFLFIDEAGDPGAGDGGSSKEYVSFCLHVSNLSYPIAAELAVQFRYWHGITKEIKGSSWNPEKSELVRRFYAAMTELSAKFLVSCSAIFLRKDEFTGPYLRSDSWKGPNPIMFRNWVLRHLLETHYRFNPRFSPILEIVFDRYDLDAVAKADLEKYIGENWNLPDVAHFTHADSMYVDFLQVTDLLQDPFLLVARGDASNSLKKALGFVNAWDFTDRDNPHQMWQQLS